MFRTKGFEKRDKAHFVLLKVIELYFEAYIHSYNHSKEPNAHPGYLTHLRQFKDKLEVVCGILTVIEIPKEDEIEFRNRLRVIEKKYKRILDNDDILREYIGVTFDLLPREENPY